MENIDMLLEENMGLVHHVIKKHFPHFVGSPHYDDAVQEGAIGLLNGIKNFDDSLGYQFSTYVYKAIQGHISKSTKDYFTPVKVPRGAYAIYKKYLELMEEGFSKEEIAKELDIKTNTLEGIVNSYNAPSLDKELYFNDGSSVSFADTLVIEEEEDFSEDIKICKTVLNLLPEREGKVFNSHINGLSQTEIGKLLGVSQVQVSRILMTTRNNYLPIIKDYINGEFGYGELLLNFYVFNKEVKPYMLTYIDLAIEMGNRGHKVSSFLQGFKFKEVSDFINKGTVVPPNVSKLLKGIDSNLYIRDIEILVEDVVGVYERGWIDIYTEAQ